MASNENIKFIVPVDEEYYFLIDRNVWERRRNTMIEEALRRVDEEMHSPDAWGYRQKGVQLVRVVAEPALLECPFCGLMPCTCDDDEEFEIEEEHDKALVELYHDVKKLSQEHDEEGIDQGDREICSDCGEARHFGPCF